MGGISLGYTIYRLRSLFVFSNSGGLGHYLSESELRSEYLHVRAKSLKKIVVCCSFVIICLYILVEISFLGIASVPI